MIRLTKTVEETIDLTEAEESVISQVLEILRSPNGYRIDVDFNTRPLYMSTEPYAVGTNWGPFTMTIRGY